MANFIGPALTRSGSAIWHVANDGSGSGLDADLLDGLNSTAFGQIANTNTWASLQTFGAGITLSSGNISASTGGTHTLGSIFKINDASSNPQLYWQHNGVDKWIMYGAGGTTMYLRDAMNARMHATYTPGASATTAGTQFGSNLTVDGNLVITGTSSFSGVVSHTTNAVLDMTSTGTTTTAAGTTTGDKIALYTDTYGIGVQAGKLVLWTSGAVGIRTPSGAGQKSTGTEGITLNASGSAVFTSSITAASASLTTPLPIASGGTNSNATPTNGGVGYGTGTAHAYTAAGTAKQVIVSNGAAAPTWVSLDLTYMPDAWVKKSVRVATTANITLSGIQTIDGVAVVATDRVLVKNQSTASQNGIYIVAAGAWTRSPGADTAAEAAGAVVFVDSGTANGGQHWETNFRATDTLGTTAMNWFVNMDTSGFATPTIALGTAAAAGSANTFIRSDSTIAAFDATVPSTQAFGDAAAVGAINFAARRDHKHAMPATPVTSAVAGTNISVSAATGAVTFGITGTIAIANGGTNSTATPTNGGVGYGTGTAHAYTAAGTTKQVIISNGAAAPTWATLDMSYLPDATFKKSVRVASTANITVASALTNGSSIDGVTVATGDRVLLKNQSAPAENGIYAVVASGAASRVTDADIASEIAASMVGVDSGTTNGGTQWYTNFKTTDTLGTTAMTWTQLSSGGAITYATPNLTLGTANAAGAASSVIRSDATILAFDATSPSTQAFGDAAAVGSATVASRRDHKHAMPANPVSYATPAFTLGTANAAGAAATLVRSDATIALFDATTPANLAAAAATGSVAFAARRDHVHSWTGLGVLANANTWTNTNQFTTISVGVAPDSTKNIYSFQAVTATSGSYLSHFNIIANHGSSSTATLTALSGTTGKTTSFAMTGGSLSTPNLMGVSGNASSGTASDIAAVVGVQGQVSASHGASNTITNAASLVAMSSFTGPTVTNYYGLHVMAPSGTMTNKWGVYVADFGTGSNQNLSLYVAGSNTWSRFQGTVLVDNQIQAGIYHNWGISGATQQTRYVGGTASGAPASGTFATGDYIVARDGVIWICTAGGSPGTWTTAGAQLNVANVWTAQQTFQNALFQSTGTTSTAMEVKGYAAQTVPLTKWTDSSGTEVSSIGPSVNNVVMNDPLFWMMVSP